MILITGASGNNGTEIIKVLSEQGVRVRALTRKHHDRGGTPIDNVAFVTADFDDVESIRQTFEGVAKRR